MSDTFKSFVYDCLRPFYLPVTSALRRRLGRNYAEHPEMELPPPYEAVQLDVERHLHQYLHVKPTDISQVVIVGASEAEEVARLRSSYPQAAFMCFEPNPNTFGHLKQRFKNAPYVTLFNCALSDKPGRAQFYEPTMPGNGSLLEPNMDNWSRTNQWTDKSLTFFDVEVDTLDRKAAALSAIDLLWMDVQGAEGQVLTGGTETLKRTKAVVLEVALAYSPYHGAQLLPQVNRTLQSFGFVCTGLGLDARTGTGNAFYVKAYESLVCE